VADPILLDASAWLAFLLKEEGAEPLEKLLEDHPLLAPELIRYEAANGVLSAKRSGRSGIKSVSLAQLLDMVWEFPIEPVPMKAWWRKAENLVQKHSLTFYDASYIACARVLDIPLLTLDRQVAKVSREEDLTLVVHGQ